MTVRQMLGHREFESPPQDTISAQGSSRGRTTAHQGYDHTTGRASHQLVVSFLTTGRVIGLLGYFLPASMLAWSLLTQSSIRSSLSEYYYTPVRDLMVGTLITMAVFLWSYRGFSDRDDDLRSDRRVGKIAGVAALIIAFSPITPRNDDRCTLIQCIIGPRPAATVHGIGATVFFVALAFFCLVLLPRSVVQTHGATSRIRLYRVCGIIIVAATAAIGIWQFLPIEVIFALGRFRPIFWLETVAICAFSTAWLVRGRALEAAIDHNYRLSRAGVAPAAA